MLVIYNRKDKKIVLICKSEDIDGRKTLARVFPDFELKNLHAFHISDNTNINLLTHRVKLDPKGQPFAIEPVGPGVGSKKITSLNDEVELEVL